MLHGLDAAFLSGAREVRAPTDPTHRPISNRPRGVPRFPPLPDAPTPAHPRFLPQAHFDRISAGLFAPSPGPDGAPPDAAAAAAAARAERVSLAAVRLAFCQHPDSRRWLARQESLLYAARLRLGERPIPPPPTDDATLRAHPHPAPPNHRWVEFERATRLVSTRTTPVVDGWTLVPDFRLVEVLAADHAAETTAALEATARRLEHATATPGAFGTPAAARLFASLAAWRPGRDETAAHDFVGGPAEIGGAGDVARGYGDWVGGDGDGNGNGGAGVSGAGADGRRQGWRRGWRRKRGSDATESSLPPRGAFGSSAVAGAGSALPYGRLPEEPFVTKMGADAKRALRVLRKGPAVATASARPFPPCVRRHLRDLHANHHLRNTARFQLTLFLKGIDLTADETLAVWRSQFAHGRFADFQREHRYHVRHAYGLEGKMADYPPHPCEKLARREMEVACPFARVGEASTSSERVGLRAELSETVTPERADEIASLAERGAPRAACARYFVATHGGGGGGGGCGGGGGGGCGGGDGDDGARDFVAEAIAHLKFPHDYYDASVSLEEAVRRAGPGPVPGGDRDADDAPARRHLAIELEGSDSETEEETEGNSNSWLGALNELTW